MAEEEFGRQIEERIRRSDLSPDDQTRVQNALRGVLEEELALIEEAAAHSRSHSRTHSRTPVEQ
jgi:hypothetical protein